MISLLTRRLTSTVLGGFLIGSSLVGYAQDESTPGIVRITDARPSGVPVHNVGYHHPQGEYHDFGGVYGDCPECYGGYGGCPHCYGKAHPHLARLFHEHYCKTSPGHGFAVPGKTPIYRRSAQYNAYFPGTWYGTPGVNSFAAAPVYPMVYQPTDTTQLGYYYQHVPFWMPNPNALPPRPIPAQWHNYVPTASLPWCGWHGCPTVGHRCWKHKHKGHDDYCPPYGDDGWVETSVVPGSPTPLPSNGTTNQAPPAEEVVPPATTPDSNKNDSAAADPILRAVLEN